MNEHKLLYGVPLFEALEASNSSGDPLSVSHRSGYIVGGPSKGTLGAWPEQRKCQSHQ